MLQRGEKKHRFKVSCISFRTIPTTLSQNQCQTQRRHQTDNKLSKWEARRPSAGNKHMLSITFQKGLKENAFPKAGLRQLQAFFILKGYLLIMNKTFPLQPVKTIYPRLQCQAATGVGTARPPDLNCCPVLYLYLPFQVSKQTASEKSNKVQMRNSPNDLIKQKPKIKVDILLFYQQQIQKSLSHTVPILCFKMLAFIIDMMENTSWPWLIQKPL